MDIQPIHSSSTKTKYMNGNFILGLQIQEIIIERDGPFWDIKETEKKGDIFTVIGVISEELIIQNKDMSISAISINRLCKNYRVIDGNEDRSEDENEDGDEDENKKDV